MSHDSVEVLSRQVAYGGDKISVRSLEESLSEARSSQDTKVQELESLRQQNGQLQESLSTEIRKLRKLTDYLGKGKLEGGFLANLKEILSFLPFLKPLTRRSIEELLRQQYEISCRRVKEASEFADRLKVAEADLHDEIGVQNERIVQSARNEDLAAEYVLELQTLKAALEERLTKVSRGSTEEREAQAELDTLRQVMSEHSTLLQLYSTAEERLARLRDNTRRLVETMGNLAGDITQYVHAASEKLDSVSGQIQALGTAADASVMMLEMKRSLDVMTESMNQTTVFVSETQGFFRQNLDRLMGDLEIYDDQTRSVLDKNLALSREVEEQRIAQAVQMALTHQQESA